MASALVAGLIENRPSEIFFEWMQSLGALPNLSEDAITEFWVNEVTKAVNWYKKTLRGSMYNTPVNRGVKVERLFF